MTFVADPPTPLANEPATRVHADEISVFALGAVLVRHRWRIVRWAMAGALIAGIPVLLRPHLWTATASFMPQGGDPGQGGIQSLAGQFGIVLPGGGISSQSPDFYILLMSSRSILGPIANDTLLVPEEGVKRRPLLELLNVTSGSAAERRDAGIKVLRTKIKAAVDRTTGVVTVSAQSRWPSVSFALVERVVKGVSEFNLHTRQSQAGEERRFVEERLAAQRQSLVTAEYRLGSFMRTNRQYGNSPELSFEHDRLERDVALQQQVLSRLAQSYEEARLREVRDIPVVTMIESPIVPVVPDRRGAITTAFVGLVAGSLVGMVLSFMRDGFRKRRADGDADALRFAESIAEVRAEIRRRVGRPVRSASADAKPVDGSSKR